MDTDVRTQQGIVRGRMAEGVAVFKGIPYAAPPFGSNRFQPPRPAERWTGCVKRSDMVQQFPNHHISHLSMYFSPSQLSPVRTA